MGLKESLQLGVGAFLAIVLLLQGVRFLRWLIPYLIDRAMKPVTECVKDFQGYLENHLSHLTKEHGLILEALEKHQRVVERQEVLLEALLDRLQGKP